MVLVTGVTTGVAYAVGGGDGGSDAIDPAGPSSGTGAVFTVGTTVYYDGGTEHVSIDDKAVKSSYYTSAGLLVRHGNNNASDGGGPQRFSLVTPDGTVKPVSVVTEETVPGVDPAQPYLAYTEVVGGVVQVVVHDISTDEEVARVDLPGDLTWGGWTGPPVALSGDTVYVGTDDATLTVDWRTGEIGTSRRARPVASRASMAAAPSGATATQSTVVDVATGEVLLTVDVGRVRLPEPLPRRPLRDPGLGGRVVFRRLRRRLGHPGHLPGRVVRLRMDAGRRPGPAEGPARRDLLDRDHRVHDRRRDDPEGRRRCRADGRPVRGADLRVLTGRARQATSSRRRTLSGSSGPGHAISSRPGCSSIAR